MSIGISATLFVLLLIATAFFVASEFSIVRIRNSRLDQMIDEGSNVKASLMKDTVKKLDGYLAACQLGITITALGLGWLGEPVVERILHPVFEAVGVSDTLITPLSFVLAFAIVTFLHVVFGELAPKTAAIQKPEAIGFFLLRPLRIFYKLAYPIIFVLNGVANRFVRLFGIQPAAEREEAHSEEELQILLTESLKHGEINQAEFGYVNNIFAFDERKAHEIMVPRTDMICLSVDDSFKDSMAIIQDTRFTRFPIIGESKDDMIGFINTKQFLLLNVEENLVNLNEIIRPVLTVSDQTPIKRLLRKMQSEGAHLAVLIDEYGGTSGMITIEDILEEIVGDIRDEFDEEEIPEIEQIADSHILVDGIALIDDVNEFLPTKIDEDEFDTIGGWLFAKNPNIEEGQRWRTEELEIRVLKRDEYRYRKLEIIFTEQPIEQL
ncbi:hemolysin family protein [Geomicrobium sediminis]|uniref:CBS domain containing-hemolysin-like protein n=1 Tax=Geomicrobium sediminis TaxID=1347788 RepID=A0ABS2PFC5_9BACL|nr:hemolysin family protein [Geomicrobium sediminis]MBM7634119.1 CBS domain containing-hemolysin-like protein [Geomicrobium sediminis]